MGNVHKVSIQNKLWSDHGGKMMKWIHKHISEDCYRLQFGSYMGRDPVTVIFENAEQAVFFRLGSGYFD